MAAPVDGDWQFFSHDPQTGVTVWVLDLGTHLAVRRDIPVDDLLDDIAAERSANEGKGWGDGKVIGSVPLGLAYSSGYMKARQEGDEAWIRRFWNNPDHRRLRTFEGRV